MTSALEQAGAVREPSQYAALSMDRGITGLWTQRSPLRDADVPYLYGKFYSASRFDSLIDGLNREITAKLTYARRAGSSVYNSNTFPALNSFYSYKRIVNGVEQVRVIADGADGNVYDATAGQKSTLFAKSGSAGKARFAGVNTELFFCDGAENEKWVFPGPWAASTNFAPGTLINVGAEPGNLQMALGGITLNIIAFDSDGTNVTLYVNPQSIPINFPNLQGVNVTFSGFTTATFLNGHTFPVAAVLSTTLGVFQIVSTQAVATRTPDNGTGSTGTGTTGGSAPSFSTTRFAVTADSGQQWKCYSSAIEKWGLQKPTQPPFIAAANAMRFWQATTPLALNYAILDNQGNIQVVFAAGTTGLNYPTWKARIPTNAAGATIATLTTDGGVQWINLGSVGVWQATTGYVFIPNTSGSLAGEVSVILDSNGNLQWCFVTGTSGGTQPTWNTTIGSTTTDGGITWKCLGPGTIFSYQTLQWSFSTHAVDGSVSTAMPIIAIQGGILGPANPNKMQTLELKTIVFSGAFNIADPQVDQIWIWRTAQGQSTLILEDQIPVDSFGAGFFTYYEQGVPDTSVSGGGSLDALIPAPINDANDPPPVGMTAPLFHLNRIWAIYQNTVIVSGGPNTITGNGNTAFAPLSSFPIPEQPIRLFATQTSNGPAVLVWGRANVYVILGSGTQNNPFQSAALYMAGCGILNYDAVCQIGSTYYAFGDTALVVIPGLGLQTVGKVFSLDPATGYTEIGFPIGDQFQKVTTGAGGKIPSGVQTGYLYNPATAFMTWASLGSGDSALYAADGSVGWFRYSPIASPESGFLWSPRAVIAGGTSAVQGIETQSGCTQLLIGPFSSGPILFRDSSVSRDNGTAYPSYDVKGCIQLCLTGELAEIAHIHLVSMPVGSRPFVGILPDEILASTAAPFTWLQATSPEPPDLKPLWSKSVYSDRYSVMQSGTTGKCMFFQLAMDYGTQNAADETLMFSVYGAKYAERKQQ